MWRLAAIVLLLVFSAMPGAWAWGTRGHETVAIIAERHLSPDAKAAVDALLAIEKRQSLADIANWADAVRLLELPGQPKHATYLPAEAESYEQPRDCPRKDCAVEAIRYFSSVLSDRTQKDEARLLALKYLVHLVGDIHQPLHAARMPGDIMIDGKPTTLHKIWDSTIVGSVGLKGEALADLVDKSYAAPNAFGGPEDWVWESYRIARDIVIPGAEGFLRTEPAEMPSSYLSDNWDLAASRLKAGGMRLAWLLDELLAPAAKQSEAVPRSDHEP
jgi:hypothetical protein